MYNIYIYIKLGNLLNNVYCENKNIKNIYIYIFRKKVNIVSASKKKKKVG